MLIWEIISPGHNNLKFIDKFGGSSEKRNDIKLFMHKKKAISCFSWAKTFNNIGSMLTLTETVMSNVLE